MNCTGLDPVSGIFDLKYPDSLSPLSKAVVMGDLKAIQKLLSKGKSPQATDNRGWSSIHYCAAFNQVEALKLILKVKSKYKKHLVNLRTHENITPLSLNIIQESPSLDIARILLEAGANPSLSTNTNFSPLHLASRKRGNLNLVKLLVDHGADVNATDELLNSTPLHLAVQEGKDLEIIEYLIKVSDLSKQNLDNHTAFIECCFSNYLEAAKIFVDFDKRLVNLKGDVPPLVCAAFVGNVAMVDVLLASGADVNLRCKALVLDPSRESIGILLDVENYLPIHSSLKNLQVFEMLLKLTEIQSFEKIKQDYSHFPLFVLIYGNIDFYEILLQSHLPEHLKSIDSKKLVNFIVRCSWETPLVEAKFKSIFKYNYNLKPSIIFCDLVDRANPRNLGKHLKVLSMLIDMGICFANNFEIKVKALDMLNNLTSVNELTNYNCLAKRAHSLLRKGTLSLKQYSRLMVRRSLFALCKTNRLTHQTIKESSLPESVKNYLYFNEG